MLDSIQAGDGLHQLIYRSVIDIADAALSREVQDILEWSRLYNARRGLTGALMVSSGRFAQVLEGPLPELRSVFGRIAMDRRHREVTLLQKLPVRARTFANWSMAYVSDAMEMAMPMRPSTAPVLADPSVGADQILAVLRYCVKDD